MANQNVAKEQYEELLKHYNTYSPLAKNVGESILNKLLTTSVNPATAEIYRKIKEASDRDQPEIIIELSNQLKAIKDNEKTHQKSLNELRKNSDWEAIKKAFHPELEAMAYEAALEGLKSAHNAIQSSKSETKTRKPKGEGESTRAPAAKKVYKISGPDNLSITMEVGQGPKAWSSEEAKILEALGIQFTRNDKGKIIVDDNKKLPDGSKLSRGNLGAALVAKVYEDKGFSATLS